MLVLHLALERLVGEGLLFVARGVRVQLYSTWTAQPMRGGNGDVFFCCMPAHLGGLSLSVKFCLYISTPRRHRN